MSFSVIIPSKTASNLIPCVEAVRKHEPDARIIVVDDTPYPTNPDDYPDCSIVRFCNRANVDWTQGTKPFIFARNCNLGIKMAGTNDVVLLNDDALLQTPGGFSKMAQFADDHSDVGCVVPATNVSGQRLQWPANRTPDGVRYVPHVPYVCVYIPKRTFERIGLLDERYCIDYGVEDRDHCYAMEQAGLKIAILYDVYVDHGSLRSSFRGNPKAPASYAKNYELYRQKWGLPA